MVIFFGTETSPSSGSSSPTIIRKSVVLPEPFGPTSPTFSPGLSWKEASTKTSCLPYCLLMEEKEIIELLCYELSAIGYQRRTPSFAAAGRPAPNAQLIPACRSPFNALSAQFSARKLECTGRSTDDTDARPCPAG